MASTRKDILNYLRNTLFPTITTANGYNNNIQTIQRGLRNSDELPDSSLPAIYIVDSEVRENITSNQFKGIITAGIIGVVRNTRGTDKLTEKMDDIVEDIGKALEADRTLNGSLLKWLEVTGIEADDSDIEPIGYVFIRVQLVYASEGITP